MWGFFFRKGCRSQIEGAEGSEFQVSFEIRIFFLIFAVDLPGSIPCATCINGPPHISDVYGYFTANWEILHGFKATLTGTGTGPMLVQHMEGSGTDVDLAVRTQSFFDASVKLTYTFRLFDRLNLDVNAGVSNIFNSITVR